MKRYSATNRTDPESLVPLKEAWPQWMTAKTAAMYLDFQHCANPVHAFRMFVRKHQVVARGGRGDVPLYHRSDLDRLVDKMGAAS